MRQSVLIGCAAMAMLFFGWLVVVRTQPSSNRSVMSKESEPTTSDSLSTDASPLAKKNVEEPWHGFVGTATCRECHSDICTAFAAHPMGRSASFANEDPPQTLGDASAFDLPRLPGADSYLNYSVDISDGEMIHCEAAKSVQTEEEIYEHRQPVQIAIGSGKRGKSYITHENGVLLMSPLTWYSQAGKWDLSPGYELHNRHFQRRIVDGCVQCHTSTPQYISDSSNLFEENPFRELPIGCERCHGPGQEHVAYHQSSGDSPERSAQDPVCRLNDLNAAQMNSVCFQCHLIGESRVLRPGMTDFDFRPGMSVNDVWVTFLRSNAGVDSEQKTEAVSHVEQMLQSKCFQGSDGEFGCTSCHDPHQQPPEESSKKFYSEKCISCHSTPPEACVSENQPVADTNCIACHMPGVKANDVPHTSQTDHRILRQPLQKNTPVKSGTGGGNFTLEVYNDGKTAVPESELDRARAIQMVATAESTGKAVFSVEAVPMLEKWLKSSPDDYLALESLGTAYHFIGDVNRAEEYWKRGLQLRPGDERFLRRLMFLYHEENRLDAGIEMGLRIVAINPRDYEVHGRLAHMFGNTNNFLQGIPHATRAIQLSPSTSELYGWLAEAYRRTGDDSKANEFQSLYQKLARKR
ncbi:MAG: hypothetical protein KDA91_17890 [Planctomycetaceae bacterium]|nr:hypothetical protein [Planctomycetaceae bacterium]